jgi:hypothetical protein
MRVKYQKLVGMLMLLAIVCSLVAITAAPASAAVTNVAITANPATASDIAGYSLVFDTTAPVPVGGTVTITFPAGVTLPATVSKAYVALGGVAWATGDGDPTVSGQQLIITIGANGPFTAGAGKTITISQGAGIKNPPIAKTKASLAYPVEVVTSVETFGKGYLGIIPSYTINPTTGTRSTSVTVTGKGWAPNQSVTVTDPNSSLAGSGVVLADGTFSMTATPVSSVGDVLIKDGAGQTNAGGSVVWDGNVTMPSFYLTPTVTVTPTSGNVGTQVLVSGRDFTPNGNISATNGIFIGGLNWNQNPPAIIMLSTIDAYGTFDDFNVTLPVPATIGGGAKTVSVTDGTKSATATFTVNTPTITLDPAMGAPNTLVAISGSHFQAADTIPIGAITFAGAAWNTALLTVDASGNWNTSLRVSSTAAIGNNPVVVTSNLGTTASAVFAVGQRALTLTPVSGPLGIYTVVQGTNMTPNGNIAVGALKFGGAAWNTAAISIDSLGNLSPTSLQVPAGFGTGPQSITATDSGTITAVGSFTVTQPTISISPTTGYKGDTLTITGAGWVPGNLGLVQISFNTQIQVVVPAPDATGAFIASLQVPVTALASNTVGAKDINNNIAADKAFLLGPQAISIAPTSGAVGTKVSITGVGFQPQSALTALTISGASVLPATPVITDSVGKFTTNFTVPGLALGAQPVAATILTVTATTFFTITAAPVTIDTQLASISSQLVIVWRYEGGGNWTFYDPTDVVGSTLTSLNAGDGFWVKVSAPCTLTYLGKSWALVADWNNKGW